MVRATFTVTHQIEHHLKKNKNKKKCCERNYNFQPKISQTTALLSRYCHMCMSKCQVLIGFSSGIHA